MNYELIAMRKQLAGTLRRIPDYDPYTQSHTVSAFLLQIDNKDGLRNQRIELSERYLLVVTPKHYQFFVNKVGIAKAGLDNPAKWHDNRVLVFLREKFAELALPALDDQLPAKSKLRRLAQFKDVSSRTHLNDDVDSILS